MKARYLVLSLTLAFTLLLILRLAVAVSGAAVPSAAVPSAAVPSAAVPSVAVLPTAQTTTLPCTVTVEVIPSDAVSLDPGLTLDAYGAHVVQQIYETLVTFKRERVDEFVPLLATGWTLAPDGRTYTFTLRSGLHFHNGAALTPEDVAYTFRRGLFTGASDSHQWLFNQALFDTQDVTELIAPDGSLANDRPALQAQPPEILYATCQTVTHAITFDNAAGTVTFHLVHPWGPFLNILAQWGHIMDQDWAIAHGAWDGDCATWQDIYATYPTSSSLVAIANGTGPFMLDHWTPGVEIALERNPSYWQTTPLWPGAPTGPAALERVLIKPVPDSATRAAMLLSGEADLSGFTSPEAALAGHVLLRYQQGVTPTLQSPTGTLYAYTALPQPYAFDALFTYHITADSEAIGSGVLDGNGIPPDFFTDIHVRKAFNYAFDWDACNAVLYQGTSLRRTGPIIKGLLGYDSAQPTYFYSPTLALQEFTQAWNGQVISSGFAITLAYNTGNLMRQTIVETLKTGIEALHPGFHIYTIEMPVTDYRWAMHNAYLPVFIGGWIQDLAHPYNWVDPYLLGMYSNYQRLPDPQRTHFADQAAACLALPDSAARSCYEGMQVSTYLSATDSFLFQLVEDRFTRAELRGYYTNIATLNQPPFYALSKGPLPVFTPVTPGVTQTIPFAGNLGATGTVVLPTGSITQPLELVLTPDIIAREAPAGFGLGHLTFDLQAYSGGVPLTGITFNSPVMVTLRYNAQTIGDLLEAELRLFWWNGTTYENAACGPIFRDTANDILEVPICHLSEFALGGYTPGGFLTHKLYLPLILRQNAP